MGDYREYENKAERSINGIANSIIAKRDNPDYNFISFLLVEGDNDSKLYEEFVDINKCSIIIADGKQRAIEVLKILENENFSGVLAIVDADFDFLEGKSLESPNLLQTDTHDIELMMVASPALEKLLRQYGSKDKIRNFTSTFGRDIRSILIECAIPLGYLRWISLREKLSLKFEALKFDRFIDREDLTINVRHMITSVQAHTTGGTRSQRPLLKDDEIHEKI